MYIRSSEQLTQQRWILSLAALDIKLTPEEVAYLDLESDTL